MIGSLAEDEVEGVVELDEEDVDDDDFMRQWVRAITRVISQWDEILNKM